MRKRRMLNFREKIEEAKICSKSEERQIESIGETKTEYKRRKRKDYKC